ncbi:MAG: redoxin domain-containing protein [Acidimicrobiia bacterium]|nr:redoxin domain-containing protein [Acidimicrobiia bacterium]
MTIAEQRAAGGPPQRPSGSGPTESGGSGSSRWKYGAVALALVVFAAAAVVFASGSDPESVTGTVDVANLPVGPTPPGLDGAKGWINSKPLTDADLAGKVVVYDFWTYSCVNCIRTLPHLRALHDRYAKDGLVIVGVHSPEFEFEKDHGNVADAVQRLHVEYPVALDDDMNIWNAFGTQYWPQKFVADRKGHVRYGHVGEGGYRETENVVRELLGVPASAPRASTEGNVKASPPPTQNISPETYLGLERGSGAATLDGPWTSEAQYVQADAAGAAIALAYSAREVNLVLAPGERGAAAIDVTVELDGAPLPPEYRTPDTMVDDQGATFVRVTGSDLYRLVIGPAVGQHTIGLTARAPGLRAFAFTFGA